MNEHKIFKILVIILLIIIISSVISIQKRTKYIKPEKIESLTDCVLQVCFRDLYGLVICREFKKNRFVTVTRVHDPVTNSDLIMIQETNKICNGE